MAAVVGRGTAKVLSEGIVMLINRGRKCVGVHYSVGKNSYVNLNNNVIKFKQ